MSKKSYTAQKFYPYFSYYCQAHRKGGFLVQNTYMSTKRLCILFTTLLAVMYSYAQTPLPISPHYTPPYNIQQLLKSCTAHCTDTSVLRYADELERTALTEKDSVAVAIAIAYKAHYYIEYAPNANLDTVTKYYNEAKELCAKSNLTTLYYWLWTKRLIRFLNTSYNFSAISYETNALFLDAVRTNLSEAFISAYLVISYIYYVQGNMEKSAQFCQIAIDIIKSDETRMTNFAYYCAILARKYLFLDMKNEAIAMLDEARKVAKDYNSKQSVEYAMAFVNAYNGDFGEAIRTYSQVGPTISYLSTEQRASDMVDIYYLSGHLQEAYKCILRNDKDSQRKHYHYIRKRILERINELDVSDEERIENFTSYLQEGRRINADLNNVMSIEESVVLVTNSQLGRKSVDYSKSLAYEKFKFSREVNILAIAILIYIAICIVYLTWLNKGLTKSVVEISRQNSVLIRKKDELHEKKKKLVEADRKKEEFVRNLSHEIRTPLNAIDGFSNVISEKKGDDSCIQELANTISENSGKLIDIIDNTVEMSLLNNDTTTK